MKRKAVLITILMIILAGVSAYPALASSDVNRGLDQLRRATAAYHSIPAANAAGYHLVPGLDYCFDNPGVGGMGYHLINTSLLDTTVERLKPEALVYDYNKFGKLQFVAVEYLVPIKDWDAGHTRLPRLFGQTFMRNDALGVYYLHAWIWLPNSLGMFTDWNPKISQCKITASPRHE